MNTDKWQYELSSNGFFVLRNCISPELLQEAKAIMAAALCRLLRKNVGLNEGILEASEIHHQADVQYLLHQELQAQKIKRRFLLHPPILDVFIRLLGPDLAFNRDGAVAINIKPTEDNLYDGKKEVLGTLD